MSLNNQAEPADTRQVLSQSDVDRLLAQVAEGDNSATIFKQGIGNATISRDAIQPCDFRQPAFLAAGELRRLRLHHENFIRCLGSRLSLHLRMEVVFQMAGLQTIGFQKFAETLPTQTHLTLFRIEPLRGTCLLEMSPRLCLTIVDRLLGGPGHSVDPNRDLTEIEIAVLNQVVDLILSEWCNQWIHLQEVRGTIMGHENNPRFLQTSAHDEVLFALAMEVRLGDCIEQCHLSFPYYTIEPLVRQLSVAQASANKDSAPAPARVPRWNSQFNNVQVPLSAGLRNIQLSARAVASFRPGDIIPLQPQQLTHIEVTLANIPKFHGRLGTCGPKWAIELTDAIPSEEESNL